jgi:hypothetical protein
MAASRSYLNSDVLEKIFQYLDFKSLCKAEMACKHWKEIINQRRLFWQLAKRLSALKIPNIILDATRKRKRDISEETFRKDRRKLLRTTTPVKNFGNQRNSI